MRYLISFILLSFFSCSENEAETEVEKQIYSHILNNCLLRSEDTLSVTLEGFKGFEWVGRKLLVVEEYSRFEEGRFSILKDSLKGLERDTYKNFIKRNTVSVSLEPLVYNLKTDFTFITNESMNQVFDDGQGWDSFYSKYSDSQGILSISRIGFNSNKTQALVYLENQENQLSGIGYFLLLEKVDNIWIEKGVLINYIS